MKKNAVLYILLVFLIIVNGFFLFHYMGWPMHDRPMGPKGPGDFIVKELKFNDSQRRKMQVLGKRHHHKIRQIDNRLKDLKNDLFQQVSRGAISPSEIDSLTDKIGQLEKEKDRATFYHLREIHELCNEKQKEQFNHIVMEALRKGSGGREGNRPPPPPPDR